MSLLLKAVNWALQSNFVRTYMKARNCFFFRFVRRYSPPISWCETMVNSTLPFYASSSWVTVFSSKRIRRCACWKENKGDVCKFSRSKGSLFFLFSQSVSVGEPHSILYSPVLRWQLLPFLSLYYLDWSLLTDRLSHTRNSLLSVRLTLRFETKYYSVPST